MPFQSKIDASAWPIYCVSYNEMKRAVYDILRADSMSVFPEKEFQELLQAELDKINLFTVIKYEDIFRSLQSVANATAIPAHLAADPIKSKQYLKRLEETIDQISTEMVNLDNYVRTNCEGFIKLVTKFDTILRSTGSSWFVSRLGKEAFTNVNLSSLFILLSLTWSKYRSAIAGPGASGAEATWKPPESFVRSTAKYWVKPENVARLKADVLKHLPYLIFGSSLKDQEQFLDPTTVLDASTPEGARMSETQLITSIYFDNINGDTYKQRILRKEGARLLRFRWYGNNEGSPDQEIFIERKVHHESWFDEASSKDRFIVKQKDVFRLMKCQYDLNEHFQALTEEYRKKQKDLKPIEAMRSLAFEVDEFIKSSSLQPFIRTCYYRCAFQLATSNDVRISLDTQMSLINEYRSGSHPSPPWCRLASDVLAESDVVRFPYAILEVKLADAKNSPQWVQSMLLNCGAVRVHKFSKFLHAMAFLHPRQVSILPHWFSDFQARTKPTTTPKSILVSSAGVASRAQRIEKILISQSSEGDQEEIPIGEPNIVPVKDMRTIEPKSIFANERTLLHYMSKATFLLVTAVGLSFGLNVDTRVLHAIKMGVSLLTLGYLILVYEDFQKRQKQLLSRQAVQKEGFEKLSVGRSPLLAALAITLGSVVAFVNSSHILEQLSLH
jgi:SPX domain protein involved in polyphosphate accumulation